MADVDELKTLVQKMKINKEKVPEELQKTKYAKPFKELTEQIKAKANEITSGTLTKGIVIRTDEDGNRLMEEIQKLIEQRKADGMGKTLGRELLKKYDVDRFLELVENIRIEIWNLWIPYWQEYCCLYVTPECWETDGPTPKVYNELMDEFLVDEERNIWEKHPEWKNEQRTIITSGACHILAGALREKEKKDGQTGEH